MLTDVRNRPPRSARLQVSSARFRPAPANGAQPGSAPPSATSGAKATRSSGLKRGADALHPLRSKDMYRQAAEGIRVPRCQSAHEGLTGCSSRLLTSQSSSGSSSLATGCSRPSPSAGASSSSSRATCSTDGGTGASCSSWRPPRSATIAGGRLVHRARSASARKAWLIVTVAAELGLARLVQVLRVVQRQRRQRAPPSRMGKPRPVDPSHASGRDLVLHIHGAVVRDRHLPGEPSSPHLGWTWRFSLRSSHTSSQGRSCAAQGCSPRSAGRTDRDPASDCPAEGRVPHIWWPVQEGGALQLRLVPRSWTQYSRTLTRTLRSRSCWRIYGYAVADLLRLQRLHRHRHRLRPPARLPLPGELQRPYTARSLQDFCDGWHTPCHRGLRDYLYIPSVAATDRAPMYRNIT